MGDVVHFPRRQRERELERELVAARGLVKGYCEALTTLRAHLETCEGTHVPIKAVRKFVSHAHEHAAAYEYMALAEHDRPPRPPAGA